MSKITKNCPHCKKNLKENGIGFSETGEITHLVDFDEREGHLTYEYDEFFGDGNEGEYYCRNCGESLDFSYEKIIEILK